MENPAVSFRKIDSILPMTEMSQQRTVVSLVGLRPVLAMVLAGSIMVASSGLAQTADSIGIAAKTPKNTVITTVGVGTQPLGIVVSHDNKTVYVANNGSNNVSVIDATNSYAVKATIAVGSGPGYLAVSPDGKTLYVSCNGAGSVYVIDTTQSTYPVKTTWATGSSPQGIAVTPNGKELYVANVGSGTVSVFETSGSGSAKTINSEGAPVHVLFTEQGKQADLLNSAGTGYVQFIKTVSGTVSSSTGAGGSIYSPSGFVTNSSGSTLYITSESYATICDARTGKVTKQILVAPSIFPGTALGQPAVTPNGKYLYVAYLYEGNTALNEVAMFDVATGKIVGQPIPVGVYPGWLQMAPNGDTLYVANLQGNSVTVIDTTL
jgi:YVTN family beta-propeller protein